MFALSMYETANMETQHRLRSEVSALVDAGVLRATHTHTNDPINAENIRRCHEAIETGRAIVLSPVTE